MNFHKNSFFYLQAYSRLQKHFRSKTIPSIIGVLEYWFSRDKFKNGFFKFSEPCASFLYKPGDSWVEELSLGRKSFNAAFSLIGMKYKSKCLFLKEKDPFKGKLYASYYDRRTNRTFYIRNHDYANLFFQSLINSPNIPREKERGFKSSPNSFSPTKGRSCNGENGCFNIYKTKITYKSSLQVSQKDSFLPNINPKENLLKSPLKILERKIGPLGSLGYQQEFLEKVKNCFFSLFEGCTQKWEAYCERITSPEFLMGKRLSSFKDWIQWAIKPENVKRILEGRFTLGNKKAPNDNNKLNPLEAKISQRMVEIWEEQVGETALSFYSSTLFKNLYETLKFHFQGTLYQWREYCLTIASSKFLMGESNSYRFKKAYLLWAIKRENIEKIKSKGFSLGDRKPFESPQELSLRKELKSRMQIKKDLEKELETIVSDVERERREAVRKEGKNPDEYLDPKTLKSYKHEFTLKLKQENTNFAKEFQQHDWKTPRAKLFFMLFLADKLASEKLGKTAGQMIEERKKVLEEKIDTLEVICQQLLSHIKNYFNHRSEGYSY